MSYRVLTAIQACIDQAESKTQEIMPLLNGVRDQIYFALTQAWIEGYEYAKNNPKDPD